MKRNLAAALCAGTALLLAGCGSSSSAASAADGTLEKTDISVGVLPLADYAAVYWADDHGFFERAGLDVTLEPLQGGPIGVQKVSAGEIDFSFSNSISATIMMDKGAPITTVVHTSSLGPRSNTIWVKPDSPITTMADLEGKTIGINTINNIGDVTFRNLAASKGIEVEPQFVEVPFNEMIAGVQAGSIDAGYTPEPFASAAEAAGLRQVVDLTEGPNAELPAATFIASNEFVEQNPDTVRAFHDAMYAAGADIRQQETEFRTWLPNVAKVPAEVAGSMSLPIFATEMDVEPLQGVADMLEQQGLIGSFDVAEHTYVAADPQK